MQINDDLYLGNARNIGVLGTTSANPTLQAGAGPLGRIYFLNIVPLLKATANIAALQHTTASTALVLTAGTGITTGLAPDGSGRTVYILDCNRCLSFTTSADMSAVTLTVLGFDRYGQPMTQNKVLPASATTANSLKAFASVLSITANVTDGTNNVSVGTADIFGLAFSAQTADYIVSNKWAGALAQDAGTFVAAVATIPATALTGDVRGTYAPSSASDGAKRLVIGQHLQASQCGYNSQLNTTASAVGLVGVPQF